MKSAKRHYWDQIAGEYQRETRISCQDFHYGPLLPGETQLHLLPSCLNGLNCLELGSGAAQNSIFLAKRGARCAALDVSLFQLRAAAQLALEHQVRLELVQGDLDHLPFRQQRRFDLIHSSYALPFALDPRNSIRQMASLLAPGGTLVISTAHPLSNAEWLEVDEGEQGIFLQNYFHPPADRRSHGGMACQAQPAPLSSVFQWLADSGLTVTRLLEPEPLPVHTMSKHEIQRQVPYSSRAWLDSYAELAAIPFVAIFVARKG